MGLKWLITGGCGFIGTSFIKCLLPESGHAIRVVDNFKVGTRQDIAAICEFTEVTTTVLNSPTTILNPNDCQLVVGDILDEQLALDVTKDIDVIVHLAANTGVFPSVENPRTDCLTNVIGTFNYLEAARFNGVKRFIFASSGAPVGEVEPPIHEELAPHPVSPYGASKLAGEGYCSAYYRTFGIETVALRFGNVYGPGSKHKNSVVAKFIKQAIAGKTLEIYGDGTQTRDFIYIDDLVKAIQLAASKPGIGGETFQIATHSEKTVNELVKTLTPVLKKKGISNYEIQYTPTRLGDVKRNYSDTSKAKNRLAWQALFDLSEGLNLTVDWFLNS